MDSWVVALRVLSRRRGLSTAHAEKVSLCSQSSALTQEKARHYQRRSQLEENVLLLSLAARSRQRSPYASCMQDDVPCDGGAPTERPSLLHLLVTRTVAFQ